MKKIVTKRLIKHIYFNKPTTFSFLQFSIYFFCDSNSNKLGFKRVPFFSKYISLKEPMGNIFKQYKSNTRNEIRKAEKLGVKFSIENDIQKFVSFYNSFADSKNRRKTSFKYLSQFGDDLIITKSYIYDDIPISMHAYILNTNSKLCMLYMSASIFRKLDKEQQKIVGYSNRFLHYKDMEYFKINQFEKYDLGGYLINAKEGSEQFYINMFKDQFGGKLTEYSNYNSYLLIITLKLLSIMRKFINSLNKKND